jgi:AcrR family transcriptional regulator
MADAEGGEPVRRGRGRPRNPETDARITAAAAELMLERGFDKTTVDEVAARAAVGKATVYRRWRSKDDLAVAAMASLFASEIPEPDTGSIRGDLTESYRRALEFVNSPAGARFVRMSVGESIRDERIAALYRSSVERREEQSRRTIKQAINRGEVRADADVDAAVQWLGGVITARAVVGRPFPAVDEAESLVEFTLRGIRS